MNDFIAKQLEAWDPLTFETDPGMLVAAQRREIRNILRSYTGYYDLFAELIQNALDAVEKRQEEGDTSYKSKIWIQIDLTQQIVAVTDNGCGMDEQQFRQFLRPSASFKTGAATRGNKGVGATYLAYGFNHVEVATRQGSKIFSGVIKRGREWVEDATETIARPKVEMGEPSRNEFRGIDRGSSMVIRLTGAAVRPRDLTWINAQTADQWMAILRSTTPLGGIYLCGATPKQVSVEVTVIDSQGTVSQSSIDAPEYLHPNTIFKRTADLRDYLADQVMRVQKGQDVSRPPAKFRSLNGIWGEWTGAEILDQKGSCPIRVRLEDSEKELVEELGVKLRIFLAFSTDLWDNYNDKTLQIRKGQRLLKGGLQLGTRHMPQGLPITIPMTNNIGFQNLAHVLVHFENAEPDLGRKGFQPEVVRISEKLSVSAVTAFRRHYGLLRKPGVAKEYEDELKLDEWKKGQVEHENKFPLIITGKGLFLPTEELSIRSEPLVEQDVVALYNQMLTSGLVRGIQLISSSQYKQYDGLFRVRMTQPLERFILSDTNPLGIDAEHFSGVDKLETVVKVLEYKYTVDGLIEELQSQVKAIEDVDLVIAWDLGSKWQQMFDVTSYLIKDNVHHRRIHGVTHSFTHSMNGNRAFDAIILKDLVSFLSDPDKEEARQRSHFEDNDFLDL